MPGKRELGAEEHGMSISGDRQQASHFQTAAGDLLEARRLARAVLIALWLGFATLLALLPHDMEIAAAVLLAGLSTLLESAHGAAAFHRLTLRLRASVQRLAR
jgi:hypothetical protein